VDTTLTSLLAEVRRHGSIPNSGGTGSEDSDLIAYLNHNLVGIAAEAIKCREGFYRRYKDHTLTSSTRYRIPTRALGSRLDAVLLLDGAGKVLRKLNEVTYSASSEVQGLTDAAGYHLEAGDIVLTPTAASGSAVTLRMVYYIRPADITSSLDTASGRCFTVTAVDTSTNVITLMASHGLLTTTKIDIMKGGPPFEYLSVDEYPSAVASTTVTVADASRVEVGDFVCQADYSPVAQVPDAFYPALSMMAAQEFRIALNDGESVKALDEQIWGDGKRTKGAMGQAIALISPRVEEGAVKIKSSYGALGALSGPGRRVY
jgi:hypothetical protein